MKRQATEKTHNRARVGPDHASNGGGNGRPEAEAVLTEMKPTEEAAASAVNGRVAEEAAEVVDTGAVQKPAAGAAAEPEARPAGQQAGQPAPQVAANYQYWREFGGTWADEYNQRKLTVPLYHIQEIMLTEYVAHHAPARVLEFGCGPGRHLRNLSQIPGIDARGYDQSAAMVSGCLTWTNQEWIDKHITVGLPTGRLPFKDGEFDLVYSAEVLVHVRPEDLPNVLTELMRISKRQVFHMEPDEHVDIISDEHSGCWKHDLVAAYAKLGKTCEILSSGYKAHAPYRVILDPKATRWQWAPLAISLYRRMEMDLTKGINDLRAAAETAQQRTAVLERGRGVADGRMDTVAGQIADRSVETERLRARVAELTTALVKQRSLAREQAAELTGQIEAERARATQAISAQWHTLHRLKKLFPEKKPGKA